MLQISDLFVNIVIIFSQVFNIFAQKTGYNETCNSSEECSDHRYKCQFDAQNVSRCLCDRYHSWVANLGCIQIYNVSEMMSMTVTVTDNIHMLDKEVNTVMQTQIAAGLFVLGTITVAAFVVAIFCIYVHITNFISDRELSNPVQKDENSRRDRINRQLMA